jgi:hypothetical protein
MSTETLEAASSLRASTFLLAGAPFRFGVFGRRIWQFLGQQGEPVRLDFVTTALYAPLYLATDDNAHLCKAGELVGGHPVGHLDPLDFGR